MTHNSPSLSSVNEAYARAGDALLDYLDKDTILAFYQTANGKEISSGKFAHPESSAALAANCFGLFVSHPGLLSLSHSLLGIGEALAVELEAEMQFPWRGGLHPCLDVAAETAQSIIGIESKRYEPFRDKKRASFSDAYFRQDWGGRMTGFETARDAFASASLAFEHLDGVQLVKHAFGLRTQGVKRGKTARLMYLYSEPSAFPNGQPISDGAVQAHRAEIDVFANMVSVDEVIFNSINYSELLGHWLCDSNEVVQRHARVVSNSFDISRLVD